MRSFFSFFCLTFICSLFLSCGGDDNCSAPGGCGPSVYDTILTYAVIDSISQNHHDDLYAYNLHVSLFKRSDGEKITPISDSTFPWIVFANEYCVSSVSVGDTIASKLLLIVSGTTSPVIIISEKPECPFRDWWHTTYEEEMLELSPYDPNRQHLCKEHIVDGYPVPGGSSVYDSIDVYATVDKITVIFEGHTYNMSFSLFRVSDNVKIAPYGASEWSRTVNSDFVSSNSISVGDTISGNLLIIVCGSSTPLVLTFRTDI